MFQINFKNMFDKKYTDIMIDIETTDVIPTAGILSIAAVPFEIWSGKVHKSPFYTTLDIQSQLDNGRTMSFETMKWWAYQDKEVRREAFSGLMLLHHRLADLKLYINDYCDENVRVWANSPAFDLTILKNAYGSKFNVWHYSQERDVHTYGQIFPEVIEELQLEPTHHPLDDCKDQITEVMSVYQKVYLNRD